MKSPLFHLRTSRLRASLLAVSLACGCSAAPTPAGAGGASAGGSSAGGIGGTGGSADSGTAAGVSVHWVEPAANASLSGTARFRFSGHGFLNVEVKRNGTTISPCTVSADHASAVCNVDTTRLPNGPLTLTAHAWDSPPSTAFVHDADAGPRSFTIANTSTPPPSGWGDFIGVCAYSKDDFPLLQSLGIQHVRYDRPSPAIIDAGRQYGIEVLPIADYGFTDLSGQSSDKYPPLPEHRAAWAKRMVDIWRGMSRPPPVIEVWNEPWHVNFWKPRPNAADYLELVKAFAREAWAVWPNVTLLVSADEGDGTYKFRNELLEADTAKFLTDRRILPTTHNYVEGRTPTTVTGSPCDWDLNRFNCAYDTFKAHGHPDPKVWVTEFGWESNTAGGNSHHATVSEALHASYHVDALRLFRSSGKVAKAYSFFVKRNDPWNYNWLRPDNSQKPVCAAVKNLIQSGG